MNYQNDRDFYSQSQTKEIEALKQLGRFKIVDRKKLIGHWVHQTRFVDLVEPNETRKSRLCVAV